MLITLNEDIQKSSSKIKRSLKSIQDSLIFDVVIKGFVFN